MKAEIYVADGRRFKSFEEVLTYASSIGLRVVNTETIRKGVHLITLSK